MHGVRMLLVLFNVETRSYMRYQSTMKISKK
jgi:hypothetical protein